LESKHPHRPALKYRAIELLLTKTLHPQG